MRGYTYPKIRLLCVSNNSVEYKMQALSYQPKCIWENAKQYYFQVEKERKQWLNAMDEVCPGMQVIPILIYFYTTIKATKL